MPVKRPMLVLTQPEPGPVPQPVQTTVLIVEDESLISWAMSSLFSSLNYEVLVASSLASARLQLFRRPDVVLLDVSLPDGSGLDLLPELAAKYPGIPAIVLSGHATQDIAAGARASGAYDVVLKPYPLDSLATLVDFAVRQSRILPLTV